MFFHSSSLKAGLTPYVKTIGEERQLFQNIKDVRFSLKLGVTTDTIMAPPMWIIQISLSIGFILLILQALAEIVKSLSPDHPDGHLND